MTIGIYETDNPAVRIAVRWDNAFPVEDPRYPFGEGVLDDLIECYENGDYYSVHLLHKVHVTYNRYNLVTGNREVSEETEWEEADSLYGCAGYWDDVAKLVARENFNVTVTGRIDE